MKDLSYKGFHFMIPSDNKSKVFLLLSSVLICLLPNIKPHTLRVWFYSIIKLPAHKKITEHLLTYWMLMSKLFKLKVFTKVL